MTNDEALYGPLPDASRRAAPTGGARFAEHDAGYRPDGRHCRPDGMQAERPAMTAFDLISPREHEILKARSWAEFERMGGGNSYPQGRPENGPESPMVVTSPTCGDKVCSRDKSPNPASQAGPQARTFDDIQRELARLPVRREALRLHEQALRNQLHANERERAKTFEVEGKLLQELLESAQAPAAAMVELLHGR